MAIIDENELISQGALERPQKLGDSLDRVYGSLVKILKAAKESESAIISSKSTSKVAQETEKLGRAQRALAKEQENAAKIAKVLWLSQNEVAESQKRAAESSKSLGTVVSELDKKLAGAANSATTYSKAQKESNVQSSQSQKIYKAEAGSLQELLQKRIQLKNAIESQKKNQQEDNDLMKRGIITRVELNKRITESESIIAKNNVGIQNLNNSIKNHILTNTQLGGEYKKLTVQLEAARNKYKDLAASGTATSQVLKAQQKVFEDLNKKVTTIDKAVGQFQRNVGNYPNTFSAAAESVKSFIGAFGIVTGIALFAKTMKEVIGLNVEFESQNSILQGILGATKSDIEGLRKQQIALGESTAFMATEYGQLQIELAKLGFPIEDIEQMTESTANAAIALGSDLAGQAELTGSTIRAFGLTAKDAVMVNDQLAKSTAASALGFEKLATGLPYVAASANKLGFSLNETLALMGELSNQGLEASTIGTSLRSIFLKLADSGSSLSKKFKEPVRDLPSLLKGLRKLTEEGTDLGEALELTDVRSVTAFASLIKGADSVETLAGTIENANGFAKQLADTVRDNLKGDFILLTSAAQELARGLGESVDGALRKIVQTATVFIQLLKGLPQFIRENKVEFIALGAAIVAFNSKAIVAAASTLLMELNTKRLIIQQRLATISTSQLSAALLANPIGLVVLAFAALAVAVDTYDRNSRRALEVDKQKNDLNKATSSEIDNVTKAQSNLNVTTEEWLKLSDSQKKSIAEQIEFTINHEKAMVSRLKAQKLTVAETARELTLWQKMKVGLLSLSGTAGAIQSVGYSFILAEENATEATAGMDEGIKKLEDEIGKLTHILDDNTAAEKRNAEEKKKADTARRKAQLELDKFRLEQQAKVQEEIIANEKAHIDDRITASMRLEQIRFKLAEVERKKDLHEEDLIAEKKILITEQEQAAKTDATRKGNKERDKLNEDQIKKDYELGLKRIKNQEDSEKILTNKLIEEFKERGEVEIQAIQQNYINGKISKEKADKEIFNVQRRVSEDLITFQISQLEKQLELERVTYYEERKKLVEKSHLDEEEKILAIQLIETESAEERANILKKLHDLKIKLTNDAFENQKGKYEDEIEMLEKIKGHYESYAGYINQIYANISAARIANLQAESNANADKLEKDLLLAGDNEKAKEVLKEKAAKREEILEKKRRAEARKAAQLEKTLALVSAGIRTALAVLNALSTVEPYPAAVVAAVSAGALGAVEIAAIASKPIPAYEDGISFKPSSGPALVGEKGSELMYSPSGDVSLTPGVPTIMDIPRGTEIIPHKETLRRLALGALSQNGGTSNSKLAYDPALINEVKQLNQNIKNIKQPRTPDLVRINGTVYAAIKDSENHTKLVRSINLGKFIK